MFVFIIYKNVFLTWFVVGIMYKVLEIGYKYVEDFTVYRG